MTPREIQRTLAERGLTPQKRFGQNFLTDPHVCRWIAQQLQAPLSSEVVELGPGLGALTSALLAEDLRVRAVELDRGYATYLRENLTHERLTVEEGDALALAESGAWDRCPFVIGNLPYNIGTPLVAVLGSRPHPPERCVFTLQLEVVERLCASDSSRAYGALSVVIQTRWRPRLLRKLDPNLFYPRPDVVSAVLRLDRREDEPPWDGESVWGEFTTFVRRGFEHRRKKLIKALMGIRNDPGLWRSAYEALGIAEGARAEHVTVSQWGTLFERHREARAGLPGEKPCIKEQST